MAHDTAVIPVLKDRPILFSPAMIRAILDGRKTQTRRVIKPQPVSEGMRSYGESWKWNEGGNNCFSGATAEQVANPNFGLIKSLPCPYGVPGDRLWIREGWEIVDHDFGRIGKKEVPVAWEIKYKADGAFEWMNPPENKRMECAKKYGTANSGIPSTTKSGWKPTALFMPCWASRITLEITDVRVQRVQEIGESDAMDEGAGVFGHEHPEWDGDPDEYRKLFRALWDSINGKKYSWSSNPFVWVISFRVI